MLRLICANCNHETRYADERAMPVHGKSCPNCKTIMRRKLSFREKKNIKLYESMQQLEANE